MYCNTKLCAVASAILVILLFNGCGNLSEQDDYSPVRFESTETGQYENTINEGGDLEFPTNDFGDRIPDYSYSGYKASEESIPDVPVRIILKPQAGDATQRIQAAIDYVSSLPLDEAGFRGAVFLESGTYEISGSLHINASGIVLRGNGPGYGGTILKGTGVDRTTLIQVSGIDNRKTGDTIPLANRYFPVNAKLLEFNDNHSFEVGDQVVVNRPSTQEWIEKIGADHIGTTMNYHLTKWNPGDFDLHWDRTVVDVTSKSITLDAPVTNALDPEYGGGSLIKYNWEGRIDNVGVENLRCVSTFDPSNEKDENHRWMAITINNTIDGWVRRITAEHFVSSAVAVWENARRITVEDSKSLSPVSEIGNYRRYAFHSLGQQVLFQRCYSEFAYHPFSVGFTAPGPNAFVQCYAYLPYNFSGTIGGWAAGVLFDKATIDGGNIEMAYRDMSGQGGGWTTANSLIWQCRAAQIHLDSPPDAENWAYGCWAQGYGNGFYEHNVTYIEPESVFYAQLKDRTGKDSEEMDKILVYESSETTAPMPEGSLAMTARSAKPDLIMKVWIDSMIRKYPIRNDFSEAIVFEDKLIEKEETEAEAAPALALIDGWLLKGNALLEGNRHRTALWRGSTRPSYVNNTSPHLSRYVPGRMGRGLTDNIDTVASDMLRHNIQVLQHFPALWYERRRDDHDRMRRADADVWAPFYEQPFSRSGQGEAFDRLSKYDLNEWNPWYWNRLKKFANLADQKGMVFIQEHYLQHNIIEEGAHWVDYPWRTANNINNTGFSEPPAYGGDKRVYMAAEFYDTTHPVRKYFHRKYIRKSLEEFMNNTNIIHHLGVEYTGPVHFVQFWLDIIHEWETENNTGVLVMLPGTKDVQDAILNDPKRAPVVDIVEILQWHYREDGSLYAPEGGVSLAARQYARIINVGETSFDQIYRAVNEYRSKYPEKAVVYSRRGADFTNWASFMAGGSFASLPVIDDASFYEKTGEIKSYTINQGNQKHYVLEKTGLGFVVFSHSPEINIEQIVIEENYNLKWIDPITGKTEDDSMEVSAETVTLNAPFEGASVAWLYK